MKHVIFPPFFLSWAQKFSISFRHEMVAHTVRSRLTAREKSKQRSLKIPREISFLLRAQRSSRSHRKLQRAATQHNGMRALRTCSKARLGQVNNYGHCYVIPSNVRSLAALFRVYISAGQVAGDGIERCCCSSHHLQISLCNRKTATFQQFRLTKCFRFTWRKLPEFSSFFPEMRQNWMKRLEKSTKVRPTFENGREKQ